jgi:hypothetical protein
VVVGFSNTKNFLKHESVFETQRHSGTEWGEISRGEGKGRRRDSSQQVC